MKQCNYVTGFTPFETTGQPAKKMGFRTGFTLIELMVVIAIIATLSALSMVSFSSLTGNRLTLDARAIAADLCWMRQMAVAKHRNQIVVFDTSSESYTLYDDLDTDSTPDANEEIKRRTLSVGIDVSSVIPSLQFYFVFPQGNTSSAGTTTITLNAQGKTRTVQVFNNTGYVRVQ